MCVCVWGGGGRHFVTATSVIVFILLQESLYYIYILQGLRGMYGIGGEICCHGETQVSCGVFAWTCQLHWPMRALQRGGWLLFKIFV
jgi:hypothetical protein